MSRFIYLVVLKCTGRTCNAYRVLGGDVVVVCIYIYIYIYILFFVKIHFSICMFSYIVFRNVLFVIFWHENHTQSVFFDFILPRGSFFLPSRGWGGGRGIFMGAFWDHLGPFYMIIYFFDSKKMKIIEQVFFFFILFAAWHFFYLPGDGVGVGGPF